MSNGDLGIGLNLDIGCYVDLIYDCEDGGIEDVSNVDE